MTMKECKLAGNESIAAVFSTELGRTLFQSGQV
jgi:hypothetical protein